MNVVERFYAAIAKEIGRKQRKPGIHVSDLIQCLRRSYYERQFGVFTSPFTILNFWRGQMLHEPSILKTHELELEWNGVHGTIDEYEDGVLLDKKTCWELPKDVDPRTKRQLEYYSVLLARNGYPVKLVQVLYVDLKSNRLMLFTVEPRSQSDIEAEMLERKAILASGELPDRNISDTYCSSCSYGRQCFASN